MAKNEVSIGVKLVTDLSDFKTGFQQAQDTSKKFGTNVEKNISSPLRAMEAQMRSLRNTQRKAITPEEYQKVGAEIKKVQGEMDAFKGKTASVKSPIDGLLSSAKGLLPAFGFAAIIAGAGAAFTKIISATDVLGTEWDAAMGGMKEGLNEFWRTMATGDWSNFTDRITEAIELGREYAYVLDDLEEKNRALSIAEADSRATELKLEEQLKNTGLSLKERIKAGDERIRIEKEMAVKRVAIAQQAYTAEETLTAAQTKLSKDQLLTLVKDMDSQTKVKAKAYLQQQADLEKMIANNTATIGTGGYGASSTIQLKDSQEIIDFRKEIAKTSEDVKLYATAYANLGRTTDEQLEKMTAGYVKLREAENSAAENTKKTVTMVNSLLATEGRAVDKLTAKTIKRNAEAGMSALQSIGSQQLTPGAIDTKTLATNNPINANKIKAEIQAVIDAEDALIEKQKAVEGAFESGFNSIGQSVLKGLGLAEDGFEGFLGSLASTVIELLAMFMAQSIAASVAGATTSGAATGPAAIFTTPAFIATAIGGVLSAFASIPKFATGGVVGGSSWSGDNVLARVNSGEEILTRNDPRHRANQSQANQSIILQPSIEMSNDRFRVILNRSESNLRKRT